ncbi:hypothetical protein RMB13_02025 [Acinetobacter sp. V102_4]|nr:hypothetical protein [Acinetobacter sp. V102_4]MDS7928272.1 hypothetical protein [Acinetobacter sp. V102_4]
MNNPTISARLFINILDGVISDSAYDKSRLQPQKTWAYIRTLIGFEIR